MPGLLAGAYSYGDSLKRKVKGLLDDPRGTLEQFVGRLGDDTNRNSDLMNQAGYFPIDKKTYTPAERASARAQLGDIGANMGISAATVWHGSPHKFDKFDSSKIGTGEGAQAYGHGLYLAESPDVAKNYQAALGRPDGAGLTKAQDVAAWAHSQGIDGVSPVSVLSDEIARLENYGKFGKRLNRADYDEAMQILQKGQAPTNGSLYKVDLPDDQIAKMLDWDKPLSQQHPDVQAALNLSKHAPDSPIHGMTGMEAYVNYGKRFGKPTSSTPETAKAFRELGIPGIRYLDGGSRGAGQGSSNFVVFPGNEDILKILERNGQGLLGN